jgi:hypothetical protein
MKRNNFSLIACFLVFVCFSQTPGYLGKRAVAGYGIELSPLTYGSNYYGKTVKGNGGSADEIQFWLNSTHHAFYEYNVRRNLMIGGALKYCRTGYDNQAKVGGINLKPIGSYKINAILFQPYFKQYYRRFVAPWGSYVMFGPVITTIISKHTPYMYASEKVNNHDTLYTNFGAKRQVHIMGDLMLGFGRSRIINEKIVIDFGFNSQLIALFTSSGTTNPEDAGYINLPAYISETAKIRMRGVNRFNFFFRVGYLF